MKTRGVTQIRARGGGVRGSVNTQAEMKMMSQQKQNMQHSEAEILCKMIVLLQPAGSHVKIKCLGKGERMTVESEWNLNLFNVRSDSPHCNQRIQIIQFYKKQATARGDQKLVR